MIKNKRGSALIWILVILILIGVGIGAYIIFTNPASEKGARALGKRLNKPVHFLPLCFRPQDIKEADQQLCEFLGTERMDTSELEKESTVLVKEIREIMTGWKAVIDYTATSRPFNLARYLVENGIDVSKVYLDAVASSDKEDFAWLKENRANTVLASPTNPAARFFHEDDHQSKNVLAIGQKAAYYEGTSNFVNMVEGGNYQGFSGLLSLLKDMKDAILKEKNVSSIIQIKGWGCNCAK